jgi:Glycosyl hydrolase family 59/Ricin-type beta-trefoil lectin domain
MVTSTHQRALHPSAMHPRDLRRFAILGILALLGSVIFSVAAPQAHAAASTTIAVNGSSAGRTFDGIGAISGGGGNSRLLSDYPAAQQSQILDYLFKPDYGANLQILKVEIGGDANSTDGAEPSIEHTSGNVQCNTGYEFWLMEQAKARNPNIKLYGLAWAAPGWIGGGNFWSTDMINYLVSWLGCAKADGLTINYLGGWNERGYNISWYEQLRSTLNADGYSAVQIVGADSDWSVANDIASNSAFANAVAIIGTHYPCAGGDGGNADTCPANATAESTGKPLWASENGSQDMTSGAPALIRSITRGYTDAEMTAYINWPLIAAIYPNLPYATDGMITAAQPWSGNYSVGESTWATAQVTQFTQPGWQFLNTGSGYLGGAETNGSYVTLKSTNNTDYSTIIESTTATAAQNVTVNVSGGLSTGTVHVWATNVNTPSPSTAMIQQANITPSNGSYSLTVQPGYIYTLTTTTGQGKGTATAPAASALALPYSDNFDADATGSEAKYLSDMQGAYQVEPCDGGRSGQCVQQMAPIKPIEWQNDSDAYALLGDTTWSNYTVSSDVYLNQAGTAEIYGRANTQARPQSDQNAYLLRASNTGAWSIDKSSTSGTITTLASGTAKALGTGSWHTLSLTMQGSTISGAIDGTAVGSVTDSSYQTGQVGIGVVGYQTDQFDNLTVTPGTGGVSVQTGPVISGMAGKCLDDSDDATADGTKIDIWTCNNTAAQQWTVDNGTVQINGKCMDVTGSGSTADGTLVELWDCNGGSNQQWTLNNGTLVNPASGKCLDDPGLSTTDGTQLDIWDCNGGVNQSWTPEQTSGPITSGMSGKCLDDAGGVTADGTAADIWDCNNTAAQQWTATGGALQVNGKCLDITGSGSTADGTLVEIWDCDGGANQVWTAENGTLVNPASGKCLDDPGFSTTNGTQLDIWDCNGGVNQAWTLTAG